MIDWWQKRCFYGHKVLVEAEQTVVFKVDMYACLHIFDSNILPDMKKMLESKINLITQHCFFHLTESLHTQTKLQQSG